MSTETPGSTAPVLSATDASMRPVDTCAADGVAHASVIMTRADDATSLAIRNLIPSSTTERSPFVRSHNRTVFASGRLLCNQRGNICNSFNYLESVTYGYQCETEGVRNTRTWIIKS